MLHPLFRIQTVSILLTAFAVYWAFRGSRRSPEATLEEKFKRLELAVTSIRAVLLCSFLFALLLGFLFHYELSTGRLDLQVSKLRTKEFILVDKNDDRRVIMETDDDGTVRLILRDLEGNNRAAMAVSGNGIPALGVMDTKGKVRSAIGMSDDHTSLIHVMDNTSQSGVLITSNDDGIITFGAQVAGKPRAGLTIMNGLPAVVLMDDKGNGRLSLRISNDGAVLVFFDDKGVNRLEIGFEGNAPHIRIYDADGNILPLKP